ncbi:serine/threonine-protein kinase [Nocardia takedensis]|uniref:serine/threonine-protein kinase n=1 Tax=Nocardia takedensis TaxID=259390 RepID=UPI003F771EF4
MVLRPGEVFAGFVIERELGRGGMGQVYLARHPRLPRRVALKLLGHADQVDDEARGRFEREGAVVARLEHPNIVTVFDRGVEDGRLWIAVQYVQGTDASHLPGGRLPVSRALSIVAETARALDYAHAVGVLHRDVKPANILVAAPSAGHGERVLLTDFGIARLRDDTKHLTRTGTFLATLSYASPEQLSALRVDHRADQYSLACTLYWLLTGSTPFEADSATAVVAGHLHLPPEPPSARRPDLPAALDEVIVRALAKDPAERFDSCTEFIDAARTALGPLETEPTRSAADGGQGAASTVVSEGPGFAGPGSRTAPTILNINSTTGHGNRGQGPTSGRVDRPNRTELHR